MHIEVDLSNEVAFDKREEGASTSKSSHKNLSNPETRPLIKYYLTNPGKM